jgi:hypothetical protein
MKKLACRVHFEFFTASRCQFSRNSVVIDLH